MLVLVDCKAAGATEQSTRALQCVPGKGGRCNRHSCGKGVHASKPKSYAAAAQVAEGKAHERAPAGARQVAEDVEQQEAELPDAEVDAPEPEADAAAVEAAVAEAAPPEPADEQYSVRPVRFLWSSCGVPVGSCAAARSGCSAVLLGIVAGQCVHACMRAA